MSYLESLPSFKTESITLYNGDCTIGMCELPDNSVDCILTDPPYKYLENQKLEVDFDEQVFFTQAKRVLKDSGFIILFGRGTSFYRWNMMLADMGFKFKEEIIWSKSYGTSPLMNISRVHETISIHTKKNGKIHKVKVPYVEMKKHDIGSIVTDIKRLKSGLKNTRSFDAVIDFLENNRIDTPDGWGTSTTISSPIAKADRSVSEVQAMRDGMNEKTIIRADRTDCDTFTKFGVNADKRQSGDRAANAMQSIAFGMNEKSIIEEHREHYDAIHPTQKPVNLLRRLLNMTTPAGSYTVLDPFSGSAATCMATQQGGWNFIGFEIDGEYYEKSVERIKNTIVQTSLF